MRGCTPGIVTRWQWWPGWDEEEGYRDPPPEGDIAVHPETGSCYLVLSVKPSRKGGGWYSMKVEGLGVGVVELGDEGTFQYGRLAYEDYEAIRQIEQIEAAILRGDEPYRELAERR